MKGQTTIGANNVPFSNSSYIGFTTQIIDKFGNSLKLFNNKNDNNLAPLYAVVHKHIFRRASVITQELQMDLRHLVVKAY